jgi:hypothetical protein
MELANSNDTLQMLSPSPPKHKSLGAHKHNSMFCVLC